MSEHTFLTDIRIEFRSKKIVFSSGLIRHDGSREELESFSLLLDDIRLTERLKQLGWLPPEKGMHSKPKQGKPVIVFKNWKRVRVVDSLVDAARMTGLSVTTIRKRIDDGKATVAGWGFDYE